MTEVSEYKTLADFEKAPDEYKHAIRKIVRSHAINELYGARCSTNPPSSLRQHRTRNG